MYILSRIMVEEIQVDKNIPQTPIHVLGNYKSVQ